MDRLKRRGWLYGLGGIAVIVLIAGLAIWLQRAPVTDLVVRRYLAANGVSAQARTSRVGSKRLVFDDVRLGPAGAPDLTARRMTLDLGWSRLTPAVRAVRIDGAQLRMRAGAGGVSFGSLDRLIPPGRSTRFPAIGLGAPGAIIRVATPAGELTWRVDASGRLDRDFRAVARLQPVALRRADCRATSAAATVVVSTAATTFDMAATGRMTGIACRGAAAPRLDWRATLAAPLSLATLRAEAALTIAPSRWQALHSGIATASAAVAGRPGALTGSWRLHGVDAGTERDHAAAFNGTGALAERRGGAVRLTGTAAATGITSMTAIAAVPATRAWPSLAVRLVDQFRRAARSIDATAQFAADLGTSPAVRLTSARATGASGMQLSFAGPGIGWTPAATSVDGHFDLGGGGLPAAHADVATVAGESRGSFEIAPWRAGDDALTVGGGRFIVASTRLRISGNVLLSSAVAGGRVEALRLPAVIALDPATGSLAVGDGCAPVTLGRASFGTTVLQPLALTVCPAARGPLLQLTGGRLAGDLEVSGLAARGSAGGRALTVTARPFRLALRGTTAAPALTTPALALSGSGGGWHGNATIAAAVAATDRGWTGRGSLSGVDAVGPALTVRDGSARWQLVAGTATVTDAAATIVDAAAVPRFAALRVAAASARLDPARMTARGTIRLASGPPSVTSATLATVAGSVDLLHRTGRATIDSALTFSPALQPLQISELARGIVANVAGKVISHADLGFGPAGLAGTGQVRFDAVALATAALGPVSGIDGTIAFDDLPRLHTPPHQALHIAAIDPGISIEDVAAEFQLLGAGSVAIERLRWPFTGGTMTVQPTILRAGVARRNFTVLVDGLDAEAFLQRFEIKNLSATGRFDGVLPLVFDGASGRIQGGVLTARATGGLLQYVGEVGQDSMGAAGKLAFDALRKLRYRTLALRLDGDLDGELVTGIDFTGTNEVPIRPAGKLPFRAAGLPFKFGVTVRAPFRALLGTAASFSDARTVIRAAKPAP